MTVELIGRAMQVGLAAVVVLGLYSWAQESAENRDVLSSLASEGGIDLASRDRAQRAYDDTCGEPNNYVDY